MEIVEKRQISKSALEGLDFQAVSKPRCPGKVWNPGGSGDRRGQSVHFIKRGGKGHGSSKKRERKKKPVTSTGDRVLGFGGRNSTMKTKKGGEVETVKAFVPRGNRDRNDQPKKVRREKKDPTFGVTGDEGGVWGKRRERFLHRLQGKAATGKPAAEGGGADNGFKKETRKKND